MFDPFLSEHVENYGNVGTGKTNYLSKTVCDELVALMAKKVLQSISKEVKNSKYFGLSVDSTPDISHKDQLCIILRYVDVQHLNQLKDLSTLCKLRITRVRN